MVEMTGGENDSLEQLAEFQNRIKGEATWVSLELEKMGYTQRPMYRRINAAAHSGAISPERAAEFHRKRKMGNCVKHCPSSRRGGCIVAEEEEDEDEDEDDRATAEETPSRKWSQLN
jgi:hypothetical protein